MIIVFLLLGVSAVSNAADPDGENIAKIILTVKFNPPAPRLVEEELHSIISATLRDVLITKKPGGIATISKHIGQIGLAIREGLNVVLEPKGFTVLDVDLDVARTTKALVSIIPAGGPPGEPGPVCTDVELSLATEDIPEFWHPLLLRDLELVRQSAVVEYSRYLIGAPLAVTDKGFILDVIGPYLDNVEPLQAAFPDFKAQTRWELDEVARIRISLVPAEPTVQRLRVRMLGSTIPNIALDELRDAITSRSDVVVGMPESLVNANLEAIGDYFAALVEADKLAEIFGARADVNFIHRPEDHSLIAMCEVRSSLYDLDLRGYIDFGNEDVDSSEVEARAGYFFTRDLEVMFVLNLFTNDMTLEPDALLGWRPTEWTFIGAGWDIEAGARKFFFTQRITQNLFAEGEIFAENDRNQFGIYYRFHQYFSGGIYATGDSDYWFRTTFRL